MSRRGWALFVAMCVIWGIPYLLIKIADESMSPIFLVFVRTAGGAALLLPLALYRREMRAVLPHWRILLVYTVVEIGAPWLLLSDAERTIGSSFAGLLVAGVPLVGAVIARFTGDDDRLEPSRLAGLLLGLAGVGALVGLTINGGDTKALIEIAVTIVGYATGPLIINRRLSHLPSTGVIAGSLALAALGYAPWALLSVPATVPAPKALFSITVLAIVCTATAFVLFFRLIAEIGPARATVITYVNPAVALLLGVTAGGERFTTGMAIGFPLVIAGSYLATRRSRRPQVAEATAVPASETAGAAC